MGASDTQVTAWPHTCVSSILLAFMPLRVVKKKKWVIKTQQSDKNRRDGLTSYFYENLRPFPWQASLACTV